MNKEVLIEKIYEIINKNIDYLESIDNHWDVHKAEAENQVLEEVLKWVRELK